MTAHTLLLVAVLPVVASAQIRLFQFDGSNETPVGSTLDVGPASPGDTIEIRLRARNAGNGPAVLRTLSLAGQGFTIAAAPSLPYTIAPEHDAEFRIAFSPTVVGSYSAFLLVNTINIVLRGTCAPAAALTLAGSNTPLIAGSVINFGSIERGGSRTQGFVLSNGGATAITVGNVSVSGTGFRGPIGAPAPLQLAPGESSSFEIAFEPETARAALGTLAIDHRVFNLQGLGLDLPLPSASIVFSSSTGTSAQQNSISLPLAEASPGSGTGTLTLVFHPTVPGVTDDAAVQFLSGPRRAATVTISAGDQAAKFNGQPSMAFQTGTTAGTIVLTLQLPNSTAQASLTIAPSMVNLDLATGVRRVNDLDVSLAGFDNTYSISQLAFTFYDINGNMIPPGVIRFDATSNFQQYFGSTQVGGMFALRATFPVAGDATQVGSVDVQVANTAGAATAQRIAFH